MPQNIRSSFPRIRYWLNEYAQEGADDRQAIAQLIQCETTETLQALRLELQMLLQFDQPDDQLDRIIGHKRRIKHGSYANWAALMLQWIVGEKH